jgi:hypothetical protein
MVTVKVCSQGSGKPLSGKRISLGFDGFFTGGVTHSEYTDSNGEVHFNSDPGDGKVYVDGQPKYKGRIAGRIVVYV